MTAFPLHPRDITDDWWAAILGRAPSRWGWEPIGTGQVGDSVRFTLEFAGETAPMTLAGKFAAADPTNIAALVKNVFCAVFQNAFCGLICFCRDVQIRTAWDFQIRSFRCDSSAGFMNRRVCGIRINAASQFAERPAFQERRDTPL